MSMHDYHFEFVVKILEIAREKDHLRLDNKNPTRKKARFYMNLLQAKKISYKKFIEKFSNIKAKKAKPSA